MCKSNKESADPPMRKGRVAAIPMREVGPLLLRGAESSGEFMVPLATFESPLWPSVERGARVTKLAGGISTVIAGDGMSRSILLEAPSAAVACETARQLGERHAEMGARVAETSEFARLKGLNTQVVGNLLYLRFSFGTGDAAGHNMSTLAADALAGWIVAEFPEMSYVSVSGNYCTDKKVSAVNGILGRGKYVIAEALIPERLCRVYLKTTSANIANLNLKKNWMGSGLAGSVRSANAHFANMLLAFYLATGQDAANIVEGSQGFTHAEARESGLYFSVTLPNIIVGSVGNGKELEFARANLELLGCRPEMPTGAAARHLAAIAAATVLCGELSLLAAQTNPGELTRAHLRMERK